LYGLLEQMADNPMVALSHAIAAAMVDGPGLLNLDQKFLQSLALPPLIINHGKLQDVWARSGGGEIQLLVPAGSQSVNPILEGDYQGLGLG
jgi:hypothetical protein